MNLFFRPFRLSSWFSVKQGPTGRKNTRGHCELISIPGHWPQDRSGPKCFFRPLGKVFFRPTGKTYSYTGLCIGITCCTVYTCCICWMHHIRCMLHTYSMLYTSVCCIYEPLFFGRPKKKIVGVYINWISQNRAGPKAVREASWQAGRAPESIEMMKRRPVFILDEQFYFGRPKKVFHMCCPAENSENARTWNSPTITKNKTFVEYN